MTVDRTRTYEAAPTTADLIDRLSTFDGPPEQFLTNLLAVQCYMSGASGGAILRADAQGPQIVAIYPPAAEGAAAPVWLAQAAELAGQVIDDGASAIRPLRSADDLYGQPARMHLIMVPVRGGQAVRGTGAFLVESRDAAALAASRERLELTAGLLSFYELRLTLQRRQLDMQRLRMAMETLSALDEHDRFTAAAMTVCNELAARLQCDRVGLGFLKGRYVHLKALSHTEKFSRKMKLVQDIEAAMEECLDQDVEVVYPCLPQAAFVSRAAKELSTRHGPTAVLSLPLRRDGAAAAVLTLQRPIDNPFGLEETEALRLTCDLATARLVSLNRHDRWFGAKAAAAARKGLAAVVGPRHTWAKLTILAVLGAAAFLTFVHGNQYAEGTFVIQSVDQKVVSAPFNGVLQTVHKEPGERVLKGEVLAEIDVSDLRVDLAKWQTELVVAQKRAATAWSENKAAEARIAEQDVLKAKEEISRLKRKIEIESVIRSPIDGVVVAGDLKRHERPTVETGNVLFEIAPLPHGLLRAELAIPEDEIAEVNLKAGANLVGELAARGFPQQHIPFTVERIIPVASVVNNANVFKVRASLAADLERTHGWVRPGMEGVARVQVGRKPYGVLWTAKLVNWIRIKLWI